MPGVLARGKTDIDDDCDQIDQRVESFAVYHSERAGFLTVNTKSRLVSFRVGVFRICFR